MSILGPVLCLASLAQAPTERVERLLGAMGTGLWIEIEAQDRARALAASEAVVRAIEATEVRLSTWREDSELARLNGAPVDEAIALSPELRSDLERVSELREQTGGAFDPSLGALVDAWDLRGEGRLPRDAELAAARAASGWSLLSLDGALATRAHPGLRIEEGAFGKGLGLDVAAEALGFQESVTYARIDLGGQLLLLGDRRHSVHVADPDERTREVARLSVAAGSIATSGNSERGLEVDGRVLSHILDPSTGRPCPDFGSVTVWCPDALRADAFSTALFVMGPARGLRWAESRDDVEALFLLRTEDGLVAHATDGLLPHLELLSPELELLFFPDLSDEE